MYSSTKFSKHLKSFCLFEELECLYTENMEQYSNGMALVPCSDPTILKVCSTAEAECQTEGIIYELEEREEPTLNESVIGRDENSKTKV